jgi:LmbE family N-acetylglucosaminyl deacetylase
MIEKLVSEAEWKDALAGLPAFTLPTGPVIFLAPHPDDETLAAGGLLAAFAEIGIPVTIVAVTDGDAAYDPAGDRKLADLRRLEQTAALALLGVPRQNIVRLDFSDRCVHEQEPQLTRYLVTLLKTAGPTTTLIAPWSSDFHSDHEATGRAAELAAARTGVRLIRWLWWSWHCRTIAELTKIPLTKFDLEPRWLVAKLTALAEHRSQLGPAAILTEDLLWPAKRSFEVFA